MPLRVPGIAQGYVDMQKVVSIVDQKEKYSIPWNSFYDLRQGRFFKGCFVEVTKN